MIMRRINKDIAKGTSKNHTLFKIKRLRRMNIFKRLIFSFLIVIIIPNIIIGTVSTEEFSKEMDRTISRFTYKTLYSLDESITSRLHIYEYLADNLSRNNELKSLLKMSAKLGEISSMTPIELQDYESMKKDIGNILYSISSNNSGITNLEIVSATDEFVIKSFDNVERGGSLNNPDIFRNTDYYKVALEAPYSYIWWDTSKDVSTYHSNVITSANLGNYITVLKTISDNLSSKTLGVIVINISVLELPDMISYRDQYVENGDLLLLSDSGIITYFTPASYVIKLDLDTLHDIRNLKTDSLVKDISGNFYLISAIKSDLTGWTLCSIIPRTSLMQRIYEIRWQIFLIMFICIVVALFLSYIVTLSISYPITRLKHAMERVDETNIDIEYTDDNEDEVGVLGHKFNSMIKRIQNLINTVYEAEINKKEEMLRRKAAELDALQMQINPHFLYNTLDIIRWQIMSEKNGESKASRMLYSFANLLRLGTKKSNRLVKISEELTHIMTYIDVVKFDLEYNLEVNYHINDEIAAYLLPKLTLQPLIENIFVHGFSHRQDKGEITIDAYTKDNDLYLEISDNGEGIPLNALDTINNNLHMPPEKSSSIGLNNVNERIALFFGEKYGLELRSITGERTTVLIHVPIISEEK
jgi:sensor histidine kinase YesM